LPVDYEKDLLALHVKDLLALHVSTSSKSDSKKKKSSKFQLNFDHFEMAKIIKNTDYASKIEFEDPIVANQVPDAVPVVAAFGNDNAAPADEDTLMRYNVNTVFLKLTIQAIFLNYIAYCIVYKDYVPAIRV